jgi:hypothetical protein
VTRPNRKFCADSESELRIHLSFKIRILDFSQSHMDAHFPDFAYILNMKLKKQLNIKKKTKMVYKKLKTLFCSDFNFLYHYVFIKKLLNFSVSQKKFILDLFSEIKTRLN